MSKPNEFIPYLSLNQLQKSQTLAEYIMHPRECHQFLQSKQTQAAYNKGDTKNKEKIKINKDNHPKFAAKSYRDLEGVACAKPALLSKVYNRQDQKTKTKLFKKRATDLFLYADRARDTTPLIMPTDQYIQIAKSDSAKNTQKPQKIDKPSKRVTYFGLKANGKIVKYSKTDVKRYSSYMCRRIPTKSDCKNEFKLTTFETLKTEFDEIICDDCDGNVDKSAVFWVCSDCPNHHICFRCADAIESGGQEDEQEE